MEGSELFRHAENWLNEKTQTFYEYKTETGYTGQPLKHVKEKETPVRVFDKGKSRVSNS